MTNYGESATIKKPEVGDVWIYENHLYHISKIEDKEDGYGLKHKDACLCVTKDKEYVSSGWYDNGMFKKYGVYLGKSVVDVSKLFTVKSFDEKQYRKDMFGEEDD